jgi:hypothetical protein
VRERRRCKKDEISNEAEGRREGEAEKEAVGEKEER